MIRLSSFPPLPPLPTHPPPPSPPVCRFSVVQSLVLHFFSSLYIMVSHFSNDLMFVWHIRPSAFLYFRIQDTSITRQLQYVAVCCSVLKCVAVCCRLLQCAAVCCSVLQCVAVYRIFCSITQLQWVAVGCGGLQ